MSLEIILVSAVFAVVISFFTDFRRINGVFEGEGFHVPPSKTSFLDKVISLFGMVILSFFWLNSRFRHWVIISMAFHIKRESNLDFARITHLNQIVAGLLNKY